MKAARLAKQAEQDWPRQLVECAGWPALLEPRMNPPGNALNLSSVPALLKPAHASTGLNAPSSAQLGSTLLPLYARPALLKR